jgi:hypothetical protein
MATAIPDKVKKACIKEGGKKGVDLVGVSDMGGVSFFNLAVETPNGDVEQLKLVMEGANLPVDEGAEERKGGASGLGKMFLSAGDDQLAVYCHVPKTLAEEKKVTMVDWVAALNAVLKGEILEQTEEYTTIVAKKDADNNRFPLKMRDEAIAAGLAFLRENGLIPANDSSSDDVNYAEAAGVEW